MMLKKTISTINGGTHDGGIEVRYTLLGLTIFVLIISGDAMTKVEYLKI